MRIAGHGEDNAGRAAICRPSPPCTSTIFETAFFRVGKTVVDRSERISFGGLDVVQEYGGRNFSGDSDVSKARTAERCDRVCARPARAGRDYRGRRLLGALG